MKDKLLQQQKHFKSKLTKDVSYRIKQLKKFKKVLKDNEPELMEAIHLDFGKSEYETYLSEFVVIYHELNTAIKNLKDWSRPIGVADTLATFPSRSYIYPEPLGSILVIGAWNYPYQISLAPCIAALAAGNTVILKPSELAKYSSAAMTKVINAHFNSEYLHVVEGGVSETTELLKLKFDKIFFTGSTRVGKIVYKAAAENLVPVTLELGGKSPTIIMPDCNLGLTAKRIVWAKYLNAGQTCIAPDYLLVHSSISSKFKTLLSENIKERYDFSDGLPSNYTQIIDVPKTERLASFITPENLLHGGDVDVPNRLITPTLLHNIKNSDPVMQDEIFGPILPILTFDSIDQVYKDLGEREKPLSAYIYTKSRKTANSFIQNVSFGGGGINESLLHLANNNLPFGGVGASGTGSYHGKFGFDCFTHYKGVLKRGPLLESPFKYKPFSGWKQRFLRLISR